MEFRKMVMITLYVRQQKRHRCIEQSFGLCGRGRGWDDSGEWHWNMYNIIYETNCQSRFNAWYWMLGAGALRRPRGMVRGWRREGGSGWGTCVYLWRIHVDVWQNQYSIVKQNKVKIKIKKKRRKLWYIYTIEYYSALKKNTFESVLMRWMKLEPIIQNEVSQKEKHQYSILTHIYGI